METEIIQEVSQVISTPPVDYILQLDMIIGCLKSIFILLSIYCGLDIGMKIGKR